MYIASQLLMFSTIVFTVTPRPCFFATPTKDHESSLNWPRTWWTHDGCSQRITHAIAPRKSSTQGEWNTIVIIVFHLQAIRIIQAQPSSSHPGPATRSFPKEIGGTPFFGSALFSSLFSGVVFFHKKTTLPSWGVVFPHDLWKPRVITESRGPAGSHPWPRRSCTCGGRWGRCARSGPSSASGALEYLEYGKVKESVYLFINDQNVATTMEHFKIPIDIEWSSFSKGCHSIFRPVDASCLGSCPMALLCALTTNGELLPFCCILGTCHNTREVRNPLAPTVLSPPCKLWAAEVPLTALCVRWLIVNNDSSHAYHDCHVTSTVHICRSHVVVEGWHV